jgi:uncharacterized protein (DUF169 family)
MSTHYIEDATMNVIEAFESRMGGRWTGIAFHRQAPMETKIERPMYFCEAVSESSTGAITLSRKDLSCLGAQRSFGWNLNGNAALVQKLTNQSGLQTPGAEALIQRTPRIQDERIVALTVGTYTAPDILISYLQPEAAMRFVMQWQRVYHSHLDISVSSIMAVCGSVAAGAFTTQKVCCSFGCPESRQHGCIGRDRLVIGVPAGLISELCSSKRNMEEKR